MTLRLKAEYTNGTLKPLEPLTLDEGTVVTIYIEQDEAIEEEEADSLLAMMEKIWESLPEEVLENLPTDGSLNYRHYLYGGPKEED